MVATYINNIGYYSILIIMVATVISVITVTLITQLMVATVY